MHLKEYIDNILNTDIEVTSLDRELYKKIPMYLTAAYNINKTTIFGQQLCLLVLKEENSMFTPDTLGKQMKAVKQLVKLPVVFVFISVTSYNVTRYIKKGINFIIPGKQMFMPSLLIDVKKTPEKAPEKVTHLLPVAQFTLLYHLQIEKLNSLTTKELTEKTGQNYRTMNRAVNNLKDLGLCELTGKKEKKMEFLYSGKELWKESLEYMQNPVERRIFSDSNYICPNIVCISGINALAKYTMINDESNKHFAIYKKDTPKLNVDTNANWGQNEIEIWKYDPKPLTKEGVIDKLSLFLIFREDDNERIQIELETMIEEIKW